MKAFTLIELMIVLAIIAILATLTLPSYQDRIIRKQIEQALVIAEIAQEEIALFYQQSQSFPEDNQQAGLPIADKFIGNFVTSVTIEKGSIHIQLGNKVNELVKSNIISLRPAIVKDAPKVPIAWICANASVPQGMEIQGENHTNIIYKYLPLSCRL